MFKKTCWILTLLVSLFLNCFCYGFEPLKLDECTHVDQQEYYNIEIFNDKGGHDDAEMCCKQCTIEFMKKNLKEYIGTKWLINTCGFYLNYDGEDKLDIKKKLVAYICDNDDCKCSKHIIFVDNNDYRIFNLHWGMSYLPRVLCLNYGHEKKIFTIEQCRID